MIIAKEFTQLEQELEALDSHDAGPCPFCGTDEPRQTELRRTQDGALLRLDRECDVCGCEHPVWFDRAA